MLIPTEHRDRGICSCLSVAQAFLPVPQVTGGTIIAAWHSRVGVLFALAFGDNCAQNICRTSGAGPVCLLLTQGSRPGLAYVAPTALTWLPNAGALSFSASHDIRLVSPASIEQTHQRRRCGTFCVRSRAMLPNTKQRNREQAKDPRSAPLFNAGTGVIFTLPPTGGRLCYSPHAHPRIRASLDALRRRPQPARAETRQPLGEIAPLRHKNASRMAAHQRARARHPPVRQRRGFFLLDRASRRCHASLRLSRPASESHARAWPRHSRNVRPVRR